MVDEVVSECQSTIAASKVGYMAGMRSFGVKADFSNVEEMVRVRKFVEEGAYVFLFYSIRLDYGSHYSLGWS